jgi:hypothetical protein
VLEDLEWGAELLDALETKFEPRDAGALEDLAMGAGSTSFRI